MKPDGRSLKEVIKMRRSGKLSPLHGQFWAEIYEKNARGERFLVHRDEKSHNDIVRTEKELVLGLLKNEGAFGGGILYHAFGVGDPTWDTMGITPVNPATDVLLFDELATGVGRTTPDIINYLDGPGGLVLPDFVGATCIKVTTTIPFIHPMNGSTFREQGLVGGDATTTKDTGRFIDAFRHEKRFKNLSVEFVYFVELFYT